ncbi:hypothetical protein Pcinc_033320 [Petrolisthes cinctipes]|uniref:Brix domain-containing protein n=1 Tax=Petrolisthes cinctipes TaxID=88211 RepID=A0AAE1ESG9_PETCI|nr:hypothetical protein Pcinc_033320 [Petrolisthes cinctipes]
MKKSQDAGRDKRREKKRAEKLGIPLPDKGPKQVPHTLESLREKDVTMVEEDDEELYQEEATDAYASYFTKAYEPKVLLTCSDNPHKKTRSFILELCKMIPGSKPVWRKKTSVKSVVKQAAEHGYTDVLIVNEDRRVPNAMLVVHLPEGPTALFRISNPKICKEINRDYKDISFHRPEVILNNFKTRLGRFIARMLGALFHYDPEFKGRRVCTFHNQRDYIFFRHHRYAFKDTEKVRLHEVGPRFTLILQWLQEGAFEGDFEWKMKSEMRTSRRRFFL